MRQIPTITFYECGMARINAKAYDILDLEAANYVSFTKDGDTLNIHFHHARPERFHVRLVRNGGGAQFRWTSVARFLYINPIGRLTITEKPKRWEVAYRVRKRRAHTADCAPRV